MGDSGSERVSFREGCCGCGYSMGLLTAISVRLIPTMNRRHDRLRERRRFM